MPRPLNTPMMSVKEDAIHALWTGITLSNAASTVLPMAEKCGGRAAGQKDRITRSKQRYVPPWQRASFVSLVSAADAPTRRSTTQRHNCWRCSRPFFIHALLTAHHRALVKSDRQASASVQSSPSPRRLCPLHPPLPLYRW